MMENKHNRLWTLLGEVIVAALLGAGLTMLLAESAGQTVDAGRIYAWAGIASLALFGLSWSRASGWLTLGVLVASASVSLALGWQPLERLHDILRAAQSRADLTQYGNDLALFAMVLLLAASYIIAYQPSGVYMMGFATIAALAIGWYYGRASVSAHILPVLIALSAMFARSESGEARHLKALLSLSLVSTILACALVPAEGVKLKPLEDAAQQALAFMIRTLNIENDQLEERRSFTIASSGWLASKDVFGGPAHPSTAEVMRVRANETAYLRGAIRYVYNTRAWVDEDNRSKAGKIKRYMLSGVEGLIYRSEYEKAFDLDKAYASRYFSPQAIQVTMLSDNPYWSIYAPGRADDLSITGGANAYFNNVGELFANRQLREGDSYSLTYGALNGKEADISQAIQASQDQKDGAYKAVLMLNRDLPAGIETGLYALTYDVVSQAATPYEKACAIRDFLKANGAYTLNAEYVPDGRDMVSYFVLESRRGYCAHFASAMAVMARIAGLPARYVEGYLASPDDTGECVITGEDAHAWAEVYFQGFGWLTFDATPNRDTDIGDGEEDAAPPTSAPTPTPTPTPAPSPTPEPTQSAQESANEPTQTPTPEPTAQTGERQTEPTATPAPAPDGAEAEENERNARGAGTGWLAALIALLALLLLLFAAFLVRRRLRATRPSNMAKDADSLMRWYRAMLTALAARQLHYENGETPESFALRAMESGACSEAFVAFSREVARVRYSERPAAEESYRLAERAYRDIERRMARKAKMKWRLYRVVRGIGPLDPIP